MRSRAGFIAAMFFDTAVVVALVLAPLLYPHMLPRVVNTFLMSVPTVPVEEPKPEPRTVTRVTQAALSVDPFQAPRLIPAVIYIPDKPEPRVNLSIADFVDPGAMIGSESPFGPAQIAVKKAADQRPMRVPSSMIEGLLIQKTIPAYPPIARATRTQGTVVLQATISRNGAIENLRVASGSPMLQQAALDAVGTWRYRPYMLNGESIAVETTIKVVFRLDE